MRGRTLFSLVLVGALVFSSAAAAGTIEDQLSSYPNSTAEGYLRPLSEALGQNLNSGGFTTAGIPRAGLHIRLELQAGIVYYGDDDRTFQAMAGGEFSNQTPTTASTIIGGTNSTSLEGEGDGTAFIFPGGLDLGSTSTLAPQITVGSFKGTEGTVRWLGIETGDTELGKLDLLGFGVRHSLSQWFDWPVDVALSGFYQTLKAGDKELFDASGLSLGGQVSKRFSVLEPFGSLTYDTWEMTSNFTVDEGTNEESVNTVEFEKDSNLHLMAGVGANFGVFRVYGAANFAQRFGLSGGIGIGN